MNGRMQRILLFGWLFTAVLPVTPAAAGGGCHLSGPDSAQPRAGTTVDMEGMCFRPGVLTVDPGATVRFTNSDDLAHVVVGTGWGTAEPIGPGEAVEHRFTQPGTFAYSCHLHPGMNGAVVVGQAAQAPAAPATAAPAALATSSTASGGADLRLLGLGGLGGTVFGAAAGQRLKVRRRRA
ncbi:MAG TPA: plastocyanin/azurin family copper-binding protein [Acidimicrobiia bacterium]|nr:plastocyanin/azurin family copper-binding protein [Acidimicrobiia bacterium]